MRSCLRRVVMDGLFGVLVGLAALLLLFFGCRDPDNLHPCDGVQPAGWVDCEVRDRAPLQNLGLPAAAFSVRGRTSNIQRVEALVCTDYEPAAAALRRRSSFPWDRRRQGSTMGTHRKGPAEQRFTKVAVSIWEHRGFRNCSLEAQHLYFATAHGRYSLRVPGVAVVERHGLAMDRLKCSMEEFDRRFSELKDAGLVEADWETGVLFFEQELLHAFNLPPSLNTVKCWRRELLGAPACPMLDRVWATLREQMSRKANPNWMAALQGTLIQKGGKKDQKKASSLPFHANEEGNFHGMGDTRSRSGSSTPKGVDPPAPANAEFEEPPADAIEDHQPPSADIELGADKERAAPRAPRPPHPSQVGQTALALMPPLNPERCAFVLQEAAGGLFTHGPLQLDGKLHKRFREEWQRVLKDYFGPLNMTQQQVEEDLKKAGRFMKARGEIVDLSMLVKFQGEQLYSYMARGLAFDGVNLPAQSAHPGPRPHRLVEDELARRRASHRSTPRPISATEQLQALQEKATPEPTPELAEWARGYGLSCFGEGA